jgi:monovalent cation/hydrogen antiporter
VSLFAPYLAYLPAEHLGASGVLAAVFAGLYLAYQIPTGLFHPGARLQALAFWDVFVFLLTSVLFILVGLQIGPVMEALGDRSTATVLGAAAVAVAAVVGTRLAWLLAFGGPAHSWGERLVIGWSGPRGAVSLAAALAVPADAPARELILFVTFAVIVATLAVQGLTLPAIVRRFAPEDAGERHHGEERARILATRAALERLKEMERRGDVSDETAHHARRRYEIRLDHLADEDDEPLDEVRRLERELAGIERDTLERLAEKGEIDQSTARRLERELDLQDERWVELERSPVG